MSSTAKPRPPSADAGLDSRLLAPVLLVASFLLIGTLNPIEPNWLRAVILMPLVLVAPGYAVLGIAFGFPVRLDAASQLGLSVLGSLAVYALLAVGMDAAGAPLDRDTIPGTVLLVGGALVALGVLRSLVLGVAPGAQASPEADPEPIIGGFRSLGLLAGALALMAGVVGLGLTVFSKPAPQTFTQVALTDAWTRLDSIVQSPSGQDITVPLSVRNDSPDAKLFDVRPAVAPIAGATALTSRWRSRRVLVPARATWRGTVSGPGPVRGCKRRLQIQVVEVTGGEFAGNLDVWLQGSRADCPGQGSVPPPQ